MGDRLLDVASVDLVRATPQDEIEAWRLLRARSDQKYRFVDSASFAIMRRLRLTRSVALDDDFRREGIETIP